MKISIDLELDFKEKAKQLKNKIYNHRKFILLVIVVSLICSVGVTYYAFHNTDNIAESGTFVTIECSKAFTGHAIIETCDKIPRANNGTIDFNKSEDVLTKNQVEIKNGVARIKLDDNKKYIKCIKVYSHKNSESIKGTCRIKVYNNHKVKYSQNSTYFFGDSDFLKANGGLAGSNYNLLDTTTGKVFNSTVSEEDI